MTLGGLGPQIPGPVESICHALADVLLADMLVEFSVTHSFRRLFPCPAKNELSP